MVLGRDVRGADAAVWRRRDVGPATDAMPRVPPVLAVEVSGRDEGEPELREKARWYLDVGVQVVWLIFTDTRDVLVLTVDGESRHRPGDRLPPHPALPGLEPEVAAFFSQLD